MSQLSSLEGILL